MAAKPFRNYQVAAPLKHSCPFSIPIPALSFRNYQVAAPLKRPRARLDLFDVRAFRNYQVAAPLKHHAIDHGRRYQDGLPQLSSCGPIEAIMPPSGKGRVFSFRNYQVAAPLKHPSKGRGSLFGGSLPQLSSCGPIEASAEIGPACKWTPFRNYQVAAPLKPIQPALAHLFDDTFRNYQVAAPLKQNFVPPKIEVLCSLPQLSSCGPIEALPQSRARRGVPPSATIKLRPH